MTTFQMGVVLSPQRRIKYLDNNKLVPYRMEGVRGIKQRQKREGKVKRRHKL